VPLAHTMIQTVCHDRANFDVSSTYGNMKLVNNYALCLLNYIWIEWLLSTLIPVPVLTTHAMCLYVELPVSNQSEPDQITSFYLNKISQFTSTSEHRHMTTRGFNVLTHKALSNVKHFFISRISTPQFISSIGATHKFVSTQKHTH
jgi:hypothetical protein